MRYFFTPLILGLLTIATLNLFVDANNRWWRTDFNFTENWKEDEVWVMPVRVDERKPRMKQIPLLDKIEVLGLGSSRFFTVDSSMLGNQRFYNASVSGASIWDFVAIWQAFKRENNIPKQLIIFADTWDFNKNTWQKYRWITNHGLVTDFLEEQETSPTEAVVRRTAEVDWLVGSFYEFSDLFSPAVLKASYEKFMAMHKSGSADADRISPTTERPLEYPALRNDGALVYSPSQEEPKPLEIINAMGRNTGLGSMQVYMRDWETDPVAIQLFHDLISDAEKYGTKVLIIQPPFQQEAYKILTAAPVYREIPAKFEEVLEELRFTHKNLRYCNALDPEKVGCGPTEFMDSSHALLSCSRKIMEFCAVF